MELGEKYLADTQIYRSVSPSSSTRCEQLPAPGLIHLMLPNARIIDARREPMRAASAI